MHHYRIKKNIILLVIFLLAAALIVAFLLFFTSSANKTEPLGSKITKYKMNKKITDLNTKVQDLHKAEKELGVVDQAKYADYLEKANQITIGSDWQNYSLAFFEIDIYSEKLSDDLASLNAKIAQAEVDRIKALKAYKQEAPQAVNKTIQVPILLYHKTPGNFAAQLDALAAKGYTTISMAQLENYFDGLGQLPAKPVVITFDDGFSDQSAAFSLLLQKNMKATFYIVVGGEKSGWCIGAMRRPQNCGDSYLDWAQIREMTKSGLIEIGAHTINHANLASLSPADQTKEILDSKTIIENELGVKITTFAYPYGRYSQATIDIALKAGFKSAVTTVSGMSQSSANRLTLTRVRDVLLLP